MDLRSYESLLLFNQGFDQILRALEQLEKVAVPSSENAHDLRVRIEELRADASADFTAAISQTAAGACAASAKKSKRASMKRNVMARNADRPWRLLSGSVLSVERREN